MKRSRPSKSLLKSILNKYEPKQSGSRVFESAKSRVKSRVKSRLTESASNVLTYANISGDPARCRRAALQMVADVVDFGVAEVAVRSSEFGGEDDGVITISYEMTDYDVEKSLNGITYVAYFSAVKMEDEDGNAFDYTRNSKLTPKKARALDELSEVRFTFSVDELTFAKMATSFDTEWNIR